MKRSMTVNEAALELRAHNAQLGPLRYRPRDGAIDEYWEATVVCGTLSFVVAGLDPEDAVLAAIDVARAQANGCFIHPRHSRGGAPS